jgi:hypothetical protein
MLSKIDRYHIEGKLTEEEKSELVTFARENANVQESVDVLKKLEDFEKRIKALEENKTSESGDEYPAFTEGKWYYNGDKCSEDGVNYVCIAPEGVVCVWSPSVYPAYWDAE